MPLYQYTAVNDLGQTLRGQMEASSESALETLLRKQGQWLADARERTARTGPDMRSRGNRPVPRRVLIEFFLQTGLQLRSGVTIVDALAFGLADQTHAGFREVQENILARVKAGAVLSEAMTFHPRTFPPLAINLIRAGEAGGRVGETCAELRRYYEWMDRLMADIRQALLYPAFVLMATVAFFFLVFTFLIPRFAAVLNEIKVPLPWITRLFLDISQFMQAHGWIVGLALAGIAIAIQAGPRASDRIARLLDRVRLHIPVFGPIHHLICLSRVAQNLAVLYQAGIPLLGALGLCRELAGNRILADAVAGLETSVNSGRQMNEAMKANPLFSRLMVQMVAVGETTGTLGESLQHVADYYNEIVPRQVKKLLAILEPVMIVGLIVMVGIVALAVFLPIATMLDAR